MATSSDKPPNSLETLDDGRPRFHGCSRIQQYDYICKLGEGTFGEVSKAKSKRTGQVVALKKILMHNEKDGFPITALREIKLLKQLDHPNILTLVEMAVERPKNAAKKTSMFTVTPYMDHDLSGLLENPNVHFTEPQIKCYMKQLLEGCAYLHENRILHRDMKAANLLINNSGLLQIADFGLARPYDDEPPKPGQGGGEATREYTTLVVTRWYRPPELLLQLRRYTTAIDMWGVGCVFGEMFKGKPILAGNSDLHQAQLIFGLVGAPTDETMPGWRELPGVDGTIEFPPRPSTLRREFRDQSNLAISLLEEFLRLDWRKRINAIDALEHPYFHTEPLPARPGDLPTFEDSHELDRRKFRDQKNKPPPAPAGGDVGVGPQGEWGINGRPLPPDQRGGRPPYANGYGRRHDRGPGRDRGGHHPPADHRHGPRDPRDHPRDRDHQRHPGPPPDSYARRPPPPAEGLPPRPPPPRDDPYRDQYHQAPPPFRDDDRGPPARIPPVHVDRRVPPGRGGPRDAFAPDYTRTDPNRRPRNDPDHPRYAPARRNSREYVEPIRYDDIPPPRYGAGRRGSRDYDEPPTRYDDRPPPPRRGSNDYDDGPVRYHEPLPPRGRPEGPPDHYDRRRSRSPRGRDWDRPPRDRDRDREYDYERRGDYRR
ncbi:serine/threonine-protein kinase bur1 [Cyphellophora europaea CBS 101466]|uniref:Serine/threonine-protein kinase bur1 n=1 Tax=Cyphellophora europaea (strain CBS 101466) TaxID=1220924 RepID=W2RV84_CYPE1|nr:serine/threonine-protein kinase bur1 [Cyphellophora europaea CBS 101466]ETN40220.1 serine/threonine-protein kinase bur1 [Cyphellophora europaea CBS 101466]